MDCLLFLWLFFCGFCGYKVLWFTFAYVKHKYWKDSQTVPEMGAPLPV